MNNPESPKETIISIVKENKVWRCLTIIMALGTTVSVIVSYRLHDKPPLVWLVSEDGRIANGNGKFFTWEAEQAARRSVELYYVMSPERDKLLDKYFTNALAEAGRNFKSKDRFVSFHVVQIEQKGADILVHGSMFRENEKTEDLNLVLMRVERSDENPFGLMVSSSSGKAKEP